MNNLYLEKYEPQHNIKQEPECFKFRTNFRITDECMKYNIENKLCRCRWRQTTQKQEKALHRKSWDFYTDLSKTPDVTHGNNEIETIAFDF